MTLHEIFFRKFTGLSLEEFNNIKKNKSLREETTGKETTIKYIREHNISEKQVKDAMTSLFYLRSIKENELKNGDKNYDD